MRTVILTAALLAVASLALAQESPAPAGAMTAKVFGASLGVNGLFNDQPSKISSDVEGTGTVRASLSPHISLVGSGAYGFQFHYWRYTAGARVTVTDVADRGLSVGVGLQYRASNEHLLDPKEWAPDVSVGWRPWLATMPSVILIGQGWYGLDSAKGGALLGVRYVLPL